jgi:hypothetical protein
MFFEKSILRILWAYNYCIHTIRTGFKTTANDNIYNFTSATTTLK